MCIIAIAKKRLTYATLTSMFAINPDGAGFAYADGGSIYVNKGFMNLTDFASAYDNMPDVQHMVHCRIATAGAVIPEFTQPFVCRSDAGNALGLAYQTSTPILMHNGHISDWKLHAKLSGISVGELNLWNDSRLLARLVARLGVDILLEYSTKEAILYPNGAIYYYGDFSKHDDTTLISSSLYDWRRTREASLVSANTPLYYDRFSD